MWVKGAAACRKKEPDTELLISPALKEKILLKEGVDLKRINYVKWYAKGKWIIEFFLKTNGDVDME